MATGTAAIITARGGSKGLPRKNLRELAGRPLICHTIQAALDCPSIDGVYVTTEDSEIAATARSAGATVIDRPVELARDDSTSRDVVLHAIDWLERANRACKSFALLQPTSPLRNALHIERCISDFFADTYGCAISVCEAEHHPARFLVLNERRCLEPWGRADQLNAPRQALPTVYRQNGAIYLMRTGDFIDRAQGFFLSPAMAFVMSAEDSVDIDSEMDFRVAQMLMEARG
jgi:N-acylneuraminate cytidylyltransferase/CMP-N,N'-diacetyllegionaminic acid synthase